MRSVIVYHTVYLLTLQQLPQFLTISTQGWSFRPILNHNISKEFKSPNQRKNNLNTYKRISFKQNNWYALRTRAPDNEIVSNETAALRALLRQQRVKRTKFAMLMAYDGQGYCGFQRNPDVKTIEEDLFNALLEARYVTEDMCNQSRLTRFEQASRTDKGVSAVGQVVSLKLPVNASSEEINKYLPKTIRVLGLVRVTQGFSSRTHSNSRTYSYTLPTHALLLQGTRPDTLLRQRVQGILEQFNGHHSFHNFTPKKSPADFSTYFRTIISFTCGMPFLNDGIEFVTLTITGRSFLMHQIRKMVGLTIAILQGLTDPATVVRALDQTQSGQLPLAPGVGLLLEEVHYKRYNEKYASDGIHKQLEWSEWKEKIESFRRKFIHPSLVKAEMNDESYVGMVGEFEEV